jgi:hypothetical protein
MSDLHRAKGSLAKILRDRKFRQRRLDAGTQNRRVESNPEEPGSEPGYKWLPGLLIWVLPERGASRTAL